MEGVSRETEPDVGKKTTVMAKRRKNTNLPMGETTAQNRKQEKSKKREAPNSRQQRRTKR
ncbi:hypothetical protein TorRG33x02_275250 [Trema orientale]|uniref:Uncharacterized protein n=1 Tax=Trema orientale TaxID=63057 RepID=A0A2P5CRZ4_TREOI|nr:hypothetical protein TorRG33x02_275250 [Trema orientale]